MSTGGLLTRRDAFEEVVIGTQTWMKRNYDFGGSYPNNDEANVTDYGRLYTWAEAMAIDFPGWHLPTSTEIAILRSYVGTNATAGGFLKEVGTTHWTTPNTDATDSVEFSARGSGISGINFNLVTFFWSSSEYDIDNAWYIRFDYSQAMAIEAYGDKKYRLSVRLIKDI